MNSIVRERIESLKDQKKGTLESIKAFENEIINLKKRVTKIEEEIQILKDSENDVSWRIKV